MLARASVSNFAELEGIKEGKLNATKTRALVSFGAYWIPDWVHPAVFQTAAGTGRPVGLDKTIGILQVQQSSQQLAQLRDTTTMMYLEVVQKNYGKAGEYSGEVFDQAQQIASSTEDPALRNLLREVLVTRDQITADLAKGDPAALSEIQRLLSNLEQTAKH